jgi:hemolysin III
VTAEDTQPPAPGRELEIGNRTTTDALPAAGELPAGTPGRRADAAAHPDGGLVRVVAGLKPGMRGWLHAGVFPFVLAGGIVLVALSGSVRAAVACSVFAVTALMLFGTSAVYHRGDWGPRGEAVLRRLDHANIFLIIAGTCTPLAVLLLAPGQQLVLLSVVWAGALIGTAFRVLWIGASRWLYTPCYIALGWVPVFYMADFARTGVATVVALIVTGGLLYTAGGIVYALRRPNPSPRWFGFHEVFHTLTIAAFAAHYAAITLAAV